MEDFGFARTDERAQASGLQAEWMESQAPSAKLELSLAVSRKERTDGPGKDVADRLDKELSTFASQKLDHPSADMQSFQNMVAKFCANPNKDQAMQDLGDSYSRLKVQMEKDAEKTYDEIQAESARQPGRKAMEADYNNKLGSFFNKVDALPESENDRVMNLLQWDALTDNKAQHEGAVRKGLANNKDLLASYNAMEAASDKIDASKSPRENQLDALQMQELRDARAMKPIVNEAYIRSTIKA